ncbi:hypothetical protein CEUSTIGMA_g7386.t1 [Chlamydomonas eustigma]|uniref:2-hydroxyacyl-CoA lyase n=1 Tax=Chlamydomonas eustigma TaxID=1157962 RepID=A0A250XA49_9CHLO|nr:hypothetical protein CEUSTIGMA_g7386.t1 [Chlamydomonas eustigma]|eukprot:GAX79947.1 hypothetical protein CEUSTIGMA_g7386.t1 [Chlamydomonas eustigma]
MALNITTLHDVLAGAHNPRTDAIILTGSSAHVTRSSLYSCVVEVSNALKKAGIKPGDVISMAYANTIDFVVAFLGVTYCRAVAAPLNAAYKTDEFSFYLEDTASKLLLLPAEGNSAAQQAADKLKVPMAHLTVSVTPDNYPIATIKPITPGLTLSGTSSRGSVPSLTDLPNPSDLALFFHTSGTTGRPKAVPLTHGNIAASLRNIALTYELSPADRSYLVMPLFHVHGLMAALLSPLAAGSAIILPKEGKFSATVFWKDCCEHAATFYTAVPTMHQVLLARAAQDYPATHPPPLRFIRSCSSSLAAPTLEKLEKAFKVPVLEAYAMSEASHQMTSNPLPKNGPRKPGTVGRAQGSVQVVVLDSNNMQVPVGKVGEVCIRGPNVTFGYLNNPKANKEAYAGGWFHTGDQGWLDAEGYLTLTGRIKELINRGGEKISPLEVDSILLSHPAVAEAVCFGVPDEKYGEVVAAAVVLRPDAPKVTDTDMEKSIKELCNSKLSAFKVPIRVFITEALPKGATGKIQRRNMAGHFMPGSTAVPAAPAASSKPPATHSGSVVKNAEEGAAGCGDGYEVVVKALCRLGVRYMFGVVGIPVTPLASSAQAAGIRYIGFRNEQAAGYAAAAAGFLTGVPSVLLTVSGPGAVHGIAGLSHAMINCWPLIQISGSCEEHEIGKGSFQECDQVSAVKPFCKYAGHATRLGDIPRVVAAAFQAATSGRPGAAYVGLPSNVLLERIPGSKPLEEVKCLLDEAVPVACGNIFRPSPSGLSVKSAAALLRSAARPLFVVGKGAAMSPGAAEAVQELANRFGYPVLGTSMGRGLLPDEHPLCANAARSLALAEADVAVIVGTRLNWQLHFGEDPRWSPDVKFVLIDVEPSDRDVGLAASVVIGDAGASLRLLVSELIAQPGLNPARHSSWTSRLTGKSRQATLALTQRLSAPPATPMDYYTTLGILRRVLQAVQGPAPMVVSEGANTMDMARLLLPVKEPRTRVDAATWGTMGVGLGSAIAAAVVNPERVTIAVEGDSAFGFSGMEVETMVRYQLPIVVFVMNNGGIYGGDRRTSILAQAAIEGANNAGFGADPPPTSFVEGSRYDLMMKAFGGREYRCTTAAELEEACRAAILTRPVRPTLIDVVLDPMAGVESGNVHAFNAPAGKSKM